MLVVTDEDAVRIGRQRGLAGAGETEEQRDVAVVADICRAVHRHHALRRQIEVQRGEDRFLHFAGIGRVADQDDLLREVDRDDRVRAHAMALGIGLERGQVDDREFGDEISKLRSHRTDQQLTNEQRMPGQLGVDAGLYPVFRIGAAVEILSEQGLAARMRDEIVVEQLEVGLGDLAIAVPPDGVLGQRVDDGVLILGRAAGMHAGLRADRAALDQRRLPCCDGMLVERRRGQIPMHRAQPLEAEFIGTVGAVPQTRFLHESPSTTHPAGTGATPLSTAVPMIAPVPRSCDL